MKIIAFAGLAKSGKTTAAQAAADHLFSLGYTPVIEQFAGPLKRAAAELGFHKGGDTDHLYREFTQWAGERARQEDIDWFVKLMAKRFDHHAQKEADRLAIGMRDLAYQGPWHETVVMLDDLRFPNEDALVKKYSGRTVFISSMRRLDDLLADWRKHPSEQVATDYENGVLPDETFDMTISNNNPDGMGSFKTIVTTLVEGIVTDAREELL